MSENVLMDPEWGGNDRGVLLLRSFNTGLIVLTQNTYHNYIHCTLSPLDGIQTRWDILDFGNINYCNHATYQPLNHQQYTSYVLHISIGFKCSSCTNNVVQYPCYHQLIHNKNSNRRYRQVPFQPTANIMT